MMARQMTLRLPEWGGKRKGAGRPRTRPHPGLEGPGVPHLRRDAFASRHPVHVTMKLHPGVVSLRPPERENILGEAPRKPRSFRFVPSPTRGNPRQVTAEP